MARKKQKKIWMYSPPKPPKPKVPEVEKQQIAQKCEALIESELKPRYVQPPPTDNDWNYVADLHGKWYRCYFYFCATYNCPSPRAIAPSFEHRFARLEYVSSDCFNLSYMRHTDKWWEVFQGLSLADCLQEIETNPLFHP